MRRNRKIRALWIVLSVIVVGGLLLSIPPIGDRVFGQLDSWRIQLRAWLFPVQEVAFVPGGVVMPTITPQTTSTPTLTPAPSATLAFTLTPQPTRTPTLQPTPLPASISLSGVKYETQNGHWNYCAPTNLSMLLSFWGWKGDREVVAKAVKPYEYDLNVMPYEMADYAETQGMRSVVRSGGSLDVLKRLVANGYPVIAEKGVYFTETTTGQLSWMGHYALITGYDDAKKQFITQDSYIKADYPISYDVLYREWRSFNYTFLVVSPADKYERLLQVLGEYADEVNAEKIALARATDETLKQTGNEQYFAWFNRGTSLVHLQDYAGAAQAYDKAFELYKSLPEDKRPWRMMWYQTGPYYSYYYSGRYQDVVNLASSTVDFIKSRAERLGITKMPQVGPFIEETFVWRARAYVVIGNRDLAIKDLRYVLDTLHSGFEPAVAELKKLGVNN